MTNDIELLPLPDGWNARILNEWGGAFVAHATAAQTAEIEALRAKTAVVMGVGTGDGNLLVHGDYESIKAAQEIVLERDALRAEVLKLKADRDSWAQQAADRVDDWDSMREHAERLEEALRAFPAEPNPYTYRIAHAKAQAVLSTHLGDSDNDH